MVPCKSLYRSVVPRRRQRPGGAASIRGEVVKIRNTVLSKKNRKPEIKTCTQNRNRGGVDDVARMVLQGRLGSPTAVLAVEFLEAVVDVGQAAGQAGSCHRGARLRVLVHGRKGSTEHPEIDAAGLVSPVKPVGEAVARIGTGKGRPQPRGRQLGSIGLPIDIGHAGRCRQGLIGDPGNQELVEAIEAGRVQPGGARPFHHRARGEIGIDPHLRADRRPLARLAGLSVSPLLSA
jgi:hypothetical protein